MLTTETIPDTELSEVGERVECAISSFTVHFPAKPPCDKPSGGETAEENKNVKDDSPVASANFDPPPYEKPQSATQCDSSFLHPLHCSSIKIVLTNIGTMRKAVAIDD